MNPKPDRAACFPDCKIAVASGAERIPALEVNLLVLWAEYAERSGYDVDGLVVETVNWAHRLRKTPEGWVVELGAFPGLPRVHLGEGFFDQQIKNQSSV
ncbi:MAG TPA: hypothetical protein VEC57_00145 [Candidatus Limnocylindrales bacterium]|nr:hypothetical protein [Candidatus Limnocylindrales bacterium]